MSCACENHRLSSEYERVAGLAKKLAVMEQKTVAVYKNTDGTYGFCVVSDNIDKPIVEYKSPY